MPSILITDASSGLGAEMARQFAVLGYDLALCARRTDRLDEVASDIARTHPGVRVSVKALDVNNHDAVFRVFEEFREELGGLEASMPTRRPPRPTSSAPWPRPRRQPGSSAPRTPATSPRASGPTCTPRRSR